MAASSSEAAAASEAASLQAQFDAAAETARQTVVVISNDTKKQIYGLFKQATEGPLNEEENPRPGILDFKGRAKYDAWKELGNLSKEQAMRNYIALIESL